VTGFANRLLGSFWIMVGVLIGLVALVYILFFARISEAAAGLLGASTPVMNFLTSHLGPGILNWWGLGLAAFLILLGVRLLGLAPVARSVAMAFHLLSGVFILIITVVLFLAINQVGGGIIDLATGGTAGNVVLYVGLFLGLVLLAIGFGLGTKQAWDAFTTGGAVTIVGGKREQPAAQPPAQEARLVNLNDGAAYELRRNVGRITIGADDKQMIVLDDASVSGSHAFIEYSGGEFLLSDNNSKNGTFVNGRRVAVLQETLKAGDEIQMGRVRLRVEM
jgi:hypothetical protein